MTVDEAARSRSQHRCGGIQCELTVSLSPDEDNELYRGREREIAFFKEGEARVETGGRGGEGQSSQ